MARNTQTKVMQINVSSVIRVRCDRCGQEVEVPFEKRLDLDDFFYWPTADSRATAHILIRMRTYTEYGGCCESTVETVSTEICPSCFAELKAWLESTGCRFTKSGY